MATGKVCRTSRHFGCHNTQSSILNFWIGLSISTQCERPMPSGLRLLHTAMIGSVVSALAVAAGWVGARVSIVYVMIHSSESQKNKKAPHRFSMSFGHWISQLAAPSRRGCPRQWLDSQPCNGRPWIQRRARYGFEPCSVSSNRTVDGFSLIGSRGSRDSITQPRLRLIAGNISGVYSRQQFSGAWLAFGELG